MRWYGLEVGSTRASSKAMRRRMSWGRYSMAGQTFDWRRGGWMIRASGVKGII